MPDGASITGVADSPGDRFVVVTFDLRGNLSPDAARLTLAPHQARPRRLLQWRRQAALPPLQLE